MKLSEIPVEKVFNATNWVVTEETKPASMSDSQIIEVSKFETKDSGLFSAVLKMKDGSEHPAIARKSFPDGGLHTDTYVHTKSGWMNILDEGFSRSVGRYSHDIYPYEIYLGNPWEGDPEILMSDPVKVQEQVNQFKEASARLRESNLD